MKEHGDGPSERAQFLIILGRVRRAEARRLSQFRVDGGSGAPRVPFAEGAKRGGIGMRDAQGSGHRRGAVVISPDVSGR